MKPISDDARQLIEQSAELCREAARNTMGISLGYDEQSICQIDAIFSQAWPDGPGGDPERNATRNQMWGCFLGEAIRHVLGGNWVHTDAGYGVRVGDAVAHPIAKIEKRVARGIAESVTFFYKSFAEVVAGDDKN